MRGVVSFMNAEDRLVAVLTEHGEYTVIGIMEEAALSVGDTITGPLEALDHQILENETRGTRLSVYVEDFELSEQDARAKLG
ncbi:MAG: hypothetical protein WED00_12415 [Aquisalimonadaceae bacterium]